jgi:hypothetical protein
VPSIRRWAVLTDPPELRARAEDGASAFEREIRNAPAGRWKPLYALADGVIPLDEAAALGGGDRPMVFLRGEVEVTAEGPVEVSVDAAEGLTLWIDGKETGLGGERATTDSLGVGRHEVIVRVDRVARASDGLRVEVVKPAGSGVEYTVVGGK